MVSPFIVTPKRHLLAQKHVVWAIKCMRRSRGLTCGEYWWWWFYWYVYILRKNKEKVPYLGRIPRLADLTQHLHVGWCPGNDHVCQISEWSLQELRFYRGSKFPFSLIFEWPLQQYSATALPVIVLHVVWLRMYCWLRNCLKITVLLFNCVTAHPRVYPQM